MNTIAAHDVRLILLTLHECLDETPSQHWKLRGNLQFILKTLTKATAGAVQIGDVS